MQVAVVAVVVPVGLVLQPLLRLHKLAPAALEQYGHIPDQLYFMLAEEAAVVHLQ
jgi:hypothetical protein